MSEIISVYKSHPPCFVSAPLPMFSPSANSPTIHFCKYICAIQNHFLEAVKAIPISVLTPLNGPTSAAWVVGCLGPECSLIYLLGLHALSKVLW